MLAALLLAHTDPETLDTVGRELERRYNIDYYVLKPWRPGDELFHRTICEFLHEWARLNRGESKEIRIVSNRWSRRADDVRTLLSRSGVPHAFYAHDSTEGVHLLEEARS